MSNKDERPHLTEEYIKEQWETITPVSVNLNAVRSYLITKCPFYSQALQMVNIDMVDVTNPSALGFTNGHRVSLNPRMYAIYEKFSKDNSIPFFRTPEMGMGFIILHEIGHIVFDSFGRLGGRNPGLWNSATDYQINQFVAKLMKEAGMFSTPQSYTDFLDVIMKNFLLDPAKYEKLSAESTYDDLYRVSVSGGGGGAQGNGSLAGDMVEPDENMSDQERMERDIVKSEMQGYAKKNAGKLAGAGSCFREFEFLLEPPKVNLRQILRQITDRECTDDWGWTSRGSRMDHLLPNGSRLPVMTQMNPDLIRKIIFVLDSSGSLSSKQLNDALNIIRECLEKFTRQTVRLIIHTDQVVYSGELKSHHDLVESFSGGTAFMPVIEHIEELRKTERIEASSVIWFTDLYGEINPEISDLRKTCKNPNKQYKWIISGSDLVANCGSSFHIDEIGY